MNPKLATKPRNWMECAAKDHRDERDAAMYNARRCVKRNHPILARHYVAMARSCHSLLMICLRRIP